LKEIQLPSLVVNKINNLKINNMNKIIAYTDGGARGNPGPAAIGAVITINGEEKRYGEAIGKTTNNIAEYQAIIFALKKIKHLIGKEKAKEAEIEINADTELVVKQMNKEYKIKNEGLKNFFIELWNLTQDFKKVTFTHVPREENKGADKLVNQALDTLI
jgi:ribonuclease HI